MNQSHVSLALVSARWLCSTRVKTLLLTRIFLRTSQVKSDGLKAGDGALFGSLIIQPWYLPSLSKAASTLAHFGPENRNSLKPIYSQ